MKNGAFFANGIKKHLAFLLAAVIVLIHVLPAVKALAEETPEDMTPGTGIESTFTPEGSETPEPKDSEEPGDETPEPTEEQTEEPTEEPTPTPTPIPDYADDGTMYLHCASPMTVSLGGVWKAAAMTYEDYGNYVGGGVANGISFLVPGIGFDGEEALLLEKYFYVDGFDPEVSDVLLSVSRIMYDAKIYVNGEPVASRKFSYINDKINISQYVLDGENSLRIVMTSGEHSFYGGGYGMGIDGDVTLECRHSIGIEKIEIDPSVSGSVDIKVTVYVREDAEISDKIEVNVFELGIFENGEAAIHSGVGTDASVFVSDGRDGLYEIDLNVRLRGFDGTKLWSPDNPYIFEADLTLAGITKSVRFGVRKVSVEEDTGYVELNDGPYFLAGITVDREIVEKLKLRTEADVRLFLTHVKSFGVNTVKGSGIVFSPMWYRLCDEEGLFLISEYPLGLVFGDNEGASDASKALQDILAFAGECRNYASCVIWDLAGEDAAVANIHSAAVSVREFDTQNRPVSVGLARPANANSVIECDVSYLGGSVFADDLSLEAPLLHTRKELDWSIRNDPSARIITMLAGNIYTRGSAINTLAETDAWWGATAAAMGLSSADTFDRIVCELIEYWRTSRKYGGIILPCGIVDAGLAREGGFFRAGFVNDLTNAFSGIGVNIESYTGTSGRGDKVSVDVAVTNNLSLDLDTVEVVFTLSAGQTVLYQETKQYDSLKKFGTIGRDIARRGFSFTMPNSIRDGTEVTLTATLISDGKEISSTRTAFVNGGETYEDPFSGPAVAIVVLSAGLIILLAVAVAFFTMRASTLKTRKQEKK